MKKFKKLITLTLMTIIILTYFTITVRATVDSIWSGRFIILVNDEPFEAWGYSTDMAILYLDLFDMAYMLNGTSAQFDILTPVDERWDFWIARGNPYVSTGAEFQPIPERFATRADGGGLFGWDRESGFDYYPEQTLIIGIDGIDEPATTIAIRTIQDIDNTYFLVSDLAAILGFNSVITTDRWHPGSDHEDFVEGIDRIITTQTHAPALLPVQSPEMVDIMVRISGQWVDREHFYSPIINESIVWPAQLSISYHGINKPVTESVAPVRPEWTHSLWEWEWLWWYPVSMQTLENGLVELAVNQPEQAQPAWSATVEHSQEDFLRLVPRFQNYRIVVDPSEKQIENIMLYIGDTLHVMRRRELWDSAARYTVEAADGGGIIIRYVFNRWDFDRAENMDFRIYRSAVPIELNRHVHRTDFDGLAMELIYNQIGIAPDDRIIFEFIDQTAEQGQVYYYSLWRMGDDWNENITPGNEPPVGNIRVVVDETPGIAEAETAESDIDYFRADQPDAVETEMSTKAESSYSTDAESNESEPLLNASNRRWLWVTALLIIFAGLSAWFIRNKFFRHKA